MEVKLSEKKFSLEVLLPTKDLFKLNMSFEDSTCYSYIITVNSKSSTTTMTMSLGIYIGSYCEKLKVYVKS